MKVLMEEAGQAFVAIIVGLMLLIIVFGVRAGEDTVGLLSIMAAAANQQSQDYGTYMDSKATAEQIKTEAGKILYDYEKPAISPNTDVNMLDYVMVEKNGRTVYASGLAEGEAVYVLGVTNKLKASESGGVTCRGDRIYSFSEPGVYTIQLKLVDADSKLVYKSLDFSVN